MDIRPVTPEETGQLQALFANAFRIGLQTAQGWTAEMDLSTTRAFVGDGRVLSVIRILPYSICIGGKTMPMAGIGGVATWADQQGKGYAGKLMAYSIGEMRRLGYPVSVLYPFSYRYYGKFGWELGGCQISYEDFQQCDAPAVRQSGGVRAALTPEDFGAVRRIYEQATQTYNGLMRRDDRMWSEYFREAAGDHAQLYLLSCTESGAEEGFFWCKDRPLPDGGFETITYPLCASHSGLRQMFGFLAALPTNVRRQKIVAPAWPSLWPFFREPFVHTRLRASFQVRVIDVEAACAARGWASEAAGSVVFSLADEHAPWNQGTWRLTVENGEARVERTQAVPEISLGIQQFSSMYIGYADPEEWVRTGILGREAAPAASTLKRLFHDRPTLLLDRF